MLEILLNYLLKIIAIGGGASAIAYGLLKLFGNKWFDHLFSQRLEKYKREQTEILEKYRYDIVCEYNRISKIHEKEFEVLPISWYKLQDSYSHFLNLASPIQQWPDINNYTNKQLESFLESCELKEFQKEEILKSEDKQRYYQNCAYWIRLSKASETFIDFRKYLRYNKIFLNHEMFDLFSQVESLLIEVETELENPNDNPWKTDFKIFKKLTVTFTKLNSSIEKNIQERLHFTRV